MAQRAWRWCMTSKRSFRSSAARLGPQVICNLHCCRSVFWTIARCAVGIYTKVLQYGAKFRAGLDRTSIATGNMYIPHSSTGGIANSAVIPERGLPAPPPPPLPPKPLPGRGRPPTIGVVTWRRCPRPPASYGRQRWRPVLLGPGAPPAAAALRRGARGHRELH